MRGGKGAAVVLTAAMTMTGAPAQAGEKTLQVFGASDFVVPQGTTSLQVRALGGAGAQGPTSDPAGRGAEATGRLIGAALQPGARLRLVANTGRGFASSPEAANGGHASDVRLCTPSACGPAERLLVAGGGGGNGSGSNPKGGDAGTPAPAQAGEDGNVAGDCATVATGGEGGQADRGGAGGNGSDAMPDGGAGGFGQGGNGVGQDQGGGGGGGGWYGGGAGGTGVFGCADGSGGGGGSSYAHPTLVADAAFALRPYPENQRSEQVFVELTYAEAVAPTVRVTAAPSGTTGRSVTFEGTAGTDTGDGPVRLVVSGSDGRSSDVPVAPDGTWEETYPDLQDGDWSWTVEQVDAAGNRSEKASGTFTVDSVPPAAPVVTAPADGSAGSNPSPAVVGTSEAGAEITVLLDDAAVATTTADGSGNWRTELGPLADGTYEVEARAMDAAGGVSPSSNVKRFTVDTVAPRTPVITAPVDGERSNDQPLRLAATAEPSIGIRFHFGEVVSGGTAARPDGTFAADQDLPEGRHVLAVIAFDRAGNTSGRAEVVVVIDRTAPAPVLGGTDGARVARVSVPATLGTAPGDGGGAWEVRRGGVTVATGDVNGDGAIEPAGLPDGPLELRLTQRDAAGNATTVVRALVLDATAPELALDPVVGEAQPLVGGAAGLAVGDVREVEASITKTGGGTIVLAGAVGEDGRFAVRPGAPLEPGTYVARVRQADDLGNTATAERTFTVPAAQVAGAQQQAPPAPRTLGATVLGAGQPGRAGASRAYGVTCARRVAATVRLAVRAPAALAITVRRKGRTISRKAIGIPAGRTVVALCLNATGLRQLGRGGSLRATASIALTAPGFATEQRRAPVRFARR